MYHKASTKIVVHFRYKKLYSPESKISEPIHLTSCIAIKSILYLVSSSLSFLKLPALLRLRTFQVAK
jgi:hypothetical protein